MVSPLPANPGRERHILIAGFAVVLVLHFFLATRNWGSGFLIGHEFRQTLTAINAYYIDAQDNFTPRYESPVLGKPWVIPLEFPLYEWSVVGLSRLMGWPHYQAARTVSLGCFYLCLPAVFLLLGHLGVPPPRRLLVLALILTCPLYIFYSRAFLMESMELMGSVWFFTTFVRTMQRRRIGWLVLAAASGTAAALIKNTTFFVWLLPAAGYGAWCLWTDLRTRAGAAAAATTLVWGLGSVVAPATALLWWIRFSDALKAPHASAHILTSTSLSTDNFQLYNLLYRLTPGSWGRLLERWHEGIMPAWIIGAVLLLCLALARPRRWILLATACFLAGQLLFPNAYAHHDYYFYACAFFLLAALGLGLLGLLDSRLPRGLVWIVMLVPLAAGLNTYRQSYYTWQNVRSAGGSGLTEALKAYTPKGSVLIIAGASWVPIIPYYAQRKALMIRSGLEWDWAYQDRAFRDLEGEDVGALVLVGDLRSNNELRRRTAARFDLDDTPTFSHPTADVYLSRHYRENAVVRLRAPHGFDGITTTAQPAPTEAGTPLVAVTPRMAAEIFPMMSPAPVSYRLQFGASFADVAGRPALGAHPDSDLTFALPPGAREAECAFGIMAGAYERAGTSTNGVRFSAAYELPDGTRREIFARTLRPFEEPHDRGDQSAVIPLADPPAGARLVFVTGTNGDGSYDWAYWRKIQIH